jgi:hypothetical protein
MVRLYATKALAEPEYADQYARMLTVALWADIDCDWFASLVTDTIRLDEILNVGGDILLHEGYIRFDLREVLDSAGY